MAYWNNTDRKRRGKIGKRVTLQTPWPGKLIIGYGWIDEKEWAKFQKGESKIMPDRSKYFEGGSFLKAEDIKDGQLVTVEKFDEAKTRLGTRPVLRLKGIEKPFGLNATNFDKMIEKFGENEKDWADKKIRLVLVQANNPQSGKLQPAIRIA